MCPKKRGFYGFTARKKQYFKMHFMTIYDLSINFRKVVQIAKYLQNTLSKGVYFSHVKL